MKNKTIKRICAGITCIVVLSIVICCVKLLNLLRIRWYAEDIQEPFYTLVVNGQIIEHTYPVQFDRYYLSDVGLFEGYDDGRIEIPLLTVLGAMGAEYRKDENGVVIIEYGDNEYYLMPEKQAMYLDGTVLSDHSAQQWDEQNLLLIWPEKKNGYFLENQGEYIVDLGSLHKLALLWDFTFDFDSERGIVYLSSNNAKFGSLPGH